MKNFIVKSYYAIPIFIFCFHCLIQFVNSGEEVEKDRERVSVVEVVRAKFGSGLDKIGILTPKEANPEGPLSFAIGEGGDIYILDQVNNRVQVFASNKGGWLRTIPIPKRGYDEKEIRGLVLGI